MNVQALDFTTREYHGGFSCTAQPKTLGAPSVFSQLLTGASFLVPVSSMLEFKPNYRFVSNSPTVMSRGYQAHIARVKLHFFSVIHLHTKPT
jgi:hypothetical protein